MQKILKAPLPLSSNQREGGSLPAPVRSFIQLARQKIFVWVLLALALQPGQPILHRLPSVAVQLIAPLAVLQ